MKKLVSCVALMLAFALPAWMDAGAKDKDKGKSAEHVKPAPPGMRSVALVNSISVPGVEDLAPFFTVPQVVYLADTTSADTMISSTHVWMSLPLYRVTKEHESRLDIEGPVTINCTTLAPFHRDGMGFSQIYAMQARLDDGDPAVMKLGTKRANPLYTTRLMGWTFGLPQGLEVQVPEGKHSVYFKVAEGDVDFCYCVFTVGRPPK